MKAETKIASIEKMLRESAEALTAEQIASLNATLGQLKATIAAPVPVPVPVAAAPVASAPVAVESPKVAAENAKRVAAGKPKMTAAEAKTFETYSPTNAEIVESACENGCEAYKDVFTFNRWIAQGFAVQKGQKATKITVYVTSRVLDPKTNETKTIKTPRQVPVFCRCQVKRLESRKAAA